MKSVLPAHVAGARGCGPVNQEYIDGQQRSFFQPYKASC
ncbi:hypothetical protein KPSA1_01163 [Pseudomonas syringae pv. actinidiae]|uniref:Uncharacterized protein n=1 Tax=Pseudomonas syringae pv. actinidiae TaxID=103796 RepID=A0A2V0Q557_PSESF|nr:hypothetical protein KPSA1_01163 [Pseudomonas syringae pv. actinidiae]GBH20171.1 hypothetical protein KPSA3_06194 [Pseudomonas syringae pv. actinidiae]